jgi:hypothetical protein
MHHRSATGLAEQRQPTRTRRPATDRRKAALDDLQEQLAEAMAGAALTPDRVGTYEDAARLNDRISTILSTHTAGPALGTVTCIAFNEGVKVQFSCRSLLHRSPDGIVTPYLWPDPTAVKLEVSQAARVFDHDRRGHIVGVNRVRLARVVGERRVCRGARPVRRPRSSHRRTPRCSRAGPDAGDGEPGEPARASAPATLRGGRS